MIIKKMFISAFGPLLDTEIDLTRGLNIIEGDNESGKSAAAMFIKFMLYGLSGRASDSISERQQYVNWTRGLAAGRLSFTLGERELRVERRLTARTDGSGKVSYNDTCVVIDESSNSPVTRSSSPGEVLLGIPEQVFMSTVFSSQDGGARGGVRPDSSALAESIENIVTSADENISVGRAVDILEKARVKLRHKRGQGGEIYELERRRDESLEAARLASAESAQIIRDELSIAETKKNIAQARLKKTLLDESAEAVEVLTKAAKIVEAEAVKSKLHDTDVLVKEYRKYDLSEEISSSVAVARSELQKYVRLKDEYTEKDAAYRKEKEAASPKSESSASSALSAARQIEGKLKRLISAAAVSLGLSLAAMLSLIFLLIAGKGILIPATLAAVFFAVGVVFIILNIRERGKLGDILESRNAFDVGDLELEVENENQAAAASSAASGELDRLSYALDSAEAEAKSALDRLHGLAVRVGLDDSGLSPDELAKSLENYAEENGEKLRKNENLAASLRGRLEELERQIGGTDEDFRKGVLARANGLHDTDIGRAAAEMSGEDISKLAREKRFTDMRLEELRNREVELERELASLKAVAVVPAGAEERLEHINARLERLGHEYDAYMLAIKSLHTASERVRSSVVPRITAEASSVMAKMTDGKYSSLAVTPSFDMRFRDNSCGDLELDYLSAGTKDAAYIALRIALARILFDNDSTPPLVFDESLCRLDPQRVGSSLSVMASENTQILLFTSHPLESTIPHSIVKL